MLDVPRQVRAGRRLDERCELRIYGSRARGERLEGRDGAAATLEPAPVRLRDARPVCRLSLRQAPRETALAQRDPEPSPQVLAPLPTSDPRRPRSATTPV
jgi:hypothetical protein